MEKVTLFNQYEKLIADLILLTSSDDKMQDGIAKQERNLVAEIENEYLATTSELQKAKRAIDSQYNSVWESCSKNAGLRKPSAQRPAYTEINWKECIAIQEKAAKEIQEWFAIKTQQALAERQKKIQEEAARKAASALSAAEAERKRKQEAEAQEIARGASLLEEMKRKFRNTN